MTYKLLIVDDETPNIRLLERLFRDDYYCLTASSGEEAISILDQHEVAVIISDQRMPQMTGIELLKRSAARRPHMVRILLTGYTDLEALVEAVNCGLVYMYVSKPWNNDDLKLRVSRAVEHYENNRRQHLLAATNERLEARLKEMRSGLVRAVAAVLHLKDPYLALHAVRVNKYAELLGARFNLSEDIFADMTAASFLHDLGAAGADEVLSCVHELRDTADMIRYHYENFDGSGGPLGLIGDQIPLAVRLLRVAKEFDLLINPRDENQALTDESAIEKLRRGSGKEFDPAVVQAFCDVAGDQMGSQRGTRSMQAA
ncbi:MAG TPA: HD domain-containing phosphohydrolase [Pyrinomonadaceae bacterium]|nr:HD domain-containing phosphohydrolase [Pyrinomonadaceae bacterium]